MEAAKAQTWAVEPQEEKMKDRILELRIKN
jgi:hypothetical protein